MFYETFSCWSRQSLYDYLILFSGSPSYLHIQWLLRDQIVGERAWVISSQYCQHLLFFFSFSFFNITCLRRFAKGVQMQLFPLGYDQMLLWFVLSNTFNAFYPANAYCISSVVTRKGTSAEQWLSHFAKSSRCIALKRYLRVVAPLDTQGITIL